jgi:phage terminase large subunit-like protein
VVELLIIMPKKNGKTTLMAALALYHLLMVEAAECVIGAASAEQAAILYRQARTMVLQSKLERKPVPGRDRRERVEYQGTFDVRAGIHEIRFELGRIRVLPADEKTTEGPIPTLALVDEYHCHVNDGLYGIFRDGLTPRHGQMITITNPGVSFDSPLGRLREQMLAYGCDAQGRRRQYTSPDGTVVLVEWGLEQEDDPADLDLVKLANPAPWQTEQELRRRRDSPSMTRAQWLRKGCGLWSAGDESPIDGSTWDKLRVDIGQVEEGEQVILVPSVGHNAAVAIVASRPDERVAVKVEVIEHDDDESMYVRTEQRVLELCQRYDVAAVHHPLVGFTRSADLLEAKGVPMVPAPHSPVGLSAASGTFNKLLRSGRLMHDGDPVLRNHVLAASVKTGESGERYVVTDRCRGLIALVMAVHAVTAMGEPTPKIHVYKGA